MILSFLIAQLVVQLPAVSPAGQLHEPANVAQLSLLVADTVSETDPQPLCGDPSCTSLFLGRYRNTTVLAGLPAPTDFAARVEMGSPWNMSYRLAMIVEQRDGRDWLVRAIAGFNERTGEACFDHRDTDSLTWDVSGPGISRRGPAICVRQ